jgi:hypothetical protein
VNSGRDVLATILLRIESQKRQSKLPILSAQFSEELPHILVDPELLSITRRVVFTPRVILQIRCLLSITDTANSTPATSSYALQLA